VIGLLLALAPALEPQVGLGTVQEATLEAHRLETGVMGTELVLEVWHANGEQARLALKAAEAEMRRVEDLMTDWRPSPLLELCAAAGHGPQKVDRELMDVIGLALEVAALTRGAFDPTYASVGALWDWRADPPRIPTDDALQEALGRVGWRRVKVDRPKHLVTLENGMQLGLGGIAKGYGVDRAMKVLMERGMQHALVNAGGDLKALGHKAGKGLWEIAIRHPRDSEQIIAVIPISNTCVATSGDYERFFEVEGKRYHHILDPRTGRPAEGCMSATVVAPDAALADALATSLCILPHDEGLKLVRTLPRVEALVVDMQGTVHRSPGLLPK
jgi:thiamine biosynthesis lipoprotein